MFPIMLQLDLAFEGADPSYWNSKFTLTDIDTGERVAYRIPGTEPLLTSDIQVRQTESAEIFKAPLFVFNDKGVRVRCYDAAGEQFYETIILNRPTKNTRGNDTDTSAGAIADEEIVAAAASSSTLLLDGQEPNSLTFWLLRADGQAAHNLNGAEVEFAEVGEELLSTLFTVTFEGTTVTVAAVEGTPIGEYACVLRVGYASTLFKINLR